MATLQRPRPVLTSAGIAGAITSIAGVLAFLGYSDVATNLSGEATTIGAVAVGAVSFGSHLLAGLHAQGKVTPNSDPITADGTPLVRMSYAAPLYAPLDDPAGVTVGADDPSVTADAATID